MHKVLRNKGPLKLIKKDKEWKNSLKLNPKLKPNWEEFSKTVAKKETIYLNERADLKEERIRYLNEFSKNYELLISAI